MFAVNYKKDVRRLWKIIIPRRRMWVSADTTPVVYLWSCPQDEMRAHYISVALPELLDAVIHIDHTDAIVPLDMTTEWRRGHAETSAA